jgi:5-methylcytosine-specific restriction enzyme A
MTAWQRPTSKTEARGYGARWRKLAAFVLRRDAYLCGCPRCLYGILRISAADAVDHIRPRALYIKEALAAGLTEYEGILASDVPTNLRAINSDCHKRVTMEQRGYRPRPRIGADGWPIDD